MSLLVYLLRSHAQVMSPALYPHNDSGVTSLAIERAASSTVPSPPAVMFQPGDTASWKVGEQLTYKQLLDLVIDAEKVITL